MKPHKWAKEIHAWADGAEIEQKIGGTWHQVLTPSWHRDTEYRIKPQPKEPQYLYVMIEEGTSMIYTKKEFDDIQDCIEEYGTYIGKIKLEADDE
jgi:hypothetical protein